MWSKIEHFQKRGLPVLEDNHAFHIDRVLQEETNYAYINEVTNSRIISSRSNCSVSILPNTFFALKYAIGMQNNSVFKPLVNKV